MFNHVVDAGGFKAESLEWQSKRPFEPRLFYRSGYRQCDFWRLECHLRLALLISFWGLAALLSGLLMLCASLVLVIERSSGGNVQPVARLALVVGLAIFFLLYAITLIQINLGLPYIGQ